MKKPIPPVASKVAGAVERAHSHLATAKAAVQAAKRQRKLAKEAVRKARKRVKEAKAEVAEAERELAGAEKHFARDAQREVKAKPKKNSSARPPVKAAIPKAKKKPKPARRAKRVSANANAPAPPAEIAGMISLEPAAGEASAPVSSTGLAAEMPPAPEAT